MSRKIFSSSAREEFIEEDQPLVPYTGKCSISTQMWAVYGKRFSPCEKAVTTLDPGQYTIGYDNALGVHFNKKDINLDDLLILPDNNSNEILEQINQFWSLEDNFRELGFLWKRGILLYGPPGSGKTSTVQLLSKQIVDMGGMSVYVDDPSLGATGLELLRNIEPSRPIVVMLEDLDAIINIYGESNLLALLDGELQIDNVVFVATTNYPERLDKRIQNRPSRFDYVRKIGMPSSAAREFFLLHKNPRLGENPKELVQWVEKSKGFSVAHLKELIISVEIFQNSLDDSVARLQKMMTQTISSDQDDERKVGFRVD